MSIEGKLFQGLEQPRAARVVATTRVLDDPDEVRSALSSAAGQGWVCFTDEVVRLKDFRQLASGPILSAEVFRDDGRSLHLRQCDTGWRLTKIREVEDDSVGEEVMAFDRDLVAAASHGGGHLAYRVYWRRGEPRTEAKVRPWEPWLAAFRGWRETKTTEEAGR